MNGTWNRKKTNGWEKQRSCKAAWATTPTCDINGLQYAENYCIFVCWCFQPTGLQAWTRGKTWSSSSCASSWGFGWKAGCSSSDWFPARHSERRLWSWPMMSESCKQGYSCKFIFSQTTSPLIVQCVYTNRHTGYFSSFGPVCRKWENTQERAYQNFLVPVTIQNSETIK